MANHLSNSRFRKIITQPEKKSIDYLKYLPIAAPLLIFFGVARLSFYYSHFNIDIIYFLNFSEIITQFFDVLIANAITIGFVSLFFVLMVHAIEIPRKVERIVMLLSILGFTVWIFFSIKNWGKTNYILLPLVILIIFLLLFIPTIAKKKFDPQLQLPTFLGIVAVMLFVIKVSAMVDASDVLGYGKYKDVKVYYKDSLITSSDKRFIGNTTNYVFVYDLKTDVTDVYKMSDIKKIDFNRWEKGQRDSTRYKYLHDSTTYKQ